MTNFKFASLGLVLFLSTLASADETLLDVVRNYTRVKILQSNNVALRPGSVYENTTIFESLFNIEHPDFNYEFLDSGLGAAEPLYPLFQKGYQWSWSQVLPAFAFPNQRHIDHFTSLMTPEGCYVQGLYMLRSINEYPANMFVKEREEGFEQIVVRLESYTRVRPDAQCGRHFSIAPDPKFNTDQFLIAHHDAMTFADFPQDQLWRFEWKISAIHHFTEELNRSKWPRLDLTQLQHNSLWYYPDGHTLDYGINARRPIPGLSSFNLPHQALVPATAEIQRKLPLAKLLKSDEFKQVMNFLNGKPVPNYDAASEPGHDVLRLSDVTSKNFYTTGLEIEKIKNVVADVSDMGHYRLVAMTIRPFETEEENVRANAPIIPQIRFVYQLMDPRHPDRPFEQLFYHLKFDVVDRGATEAVRDEQHLHFLREVDQLTHAKDANDPNFTDKFLSFVSEFTNRPMQSLAFSSSLTGIWEFGTLARKTPKSALTALRIIRDGIDIGYYSSIYDNDLFRAELANNAVNPARKDRLQKHMDDILPQKYRSPMRQDVQAVTFNRVTCAQCHQTSARDGVHVAFNDFLDRRNTEPVNATEYFMHEADRQLLLGSKYFQH